MRRNMWWIPMSENPDWGSEEARTTLVDPSICLWCKCEITDGDAAVELATGERLCGERACLGDLREFKRTHFADLVYDTSIAPSIRASLLDDWQSLLDTLAELHDSDPKLKSLPSRISNANERRIPSDDSGRISNDDRT